MEKELYCFNMLNVFNMLSIRTQLKDKFSQHQLIPIMLTESQMEERREKQKEEKRKWMKGLRYFNKVLSNGCGEGRRNPPKEGIRPKIDFGEDQG